ncbi:hypothetical protein [Algoriphagus hitonicola]|uniref:Uncharacterized protein n=1 Tax=Algoriphagus hitonicola TaxID=435880 RepID=A0A1I2U387_9BACT|nr:hypothetical protein [Algoriphagus hitonicola]SFG71635.1 hypothetical protein SAMN04487988_10723 [Algoriphagus hitonicola]
MKIKLFLSLSLILLGFGSIGVRAEKEVVIKCPDGDKYKCYEKEGLAVFKGEGVTEIIIPVITP